ncbi:hypothetical protein Tco_0250414 [Tanacetum coccineum]
MSTSSNSTNSNQQTLVDSGANKRPLMLEKRNYIPWESRFRSFLDNKLEERERMWNSIQNGPYQRPMVVDLINHTVPILEPLSKMIEGNKKQYIANERIKRLMHGSKITTHVRHSRLMDKFDKFAAKERESLDSVHERLTTLMNIMDHNNRFETTTPEGVDLVLWGDLRTMFDANADDELLQNQERWNLKS